MNIVDPSFEEWQKNNADKTYHDFIYEISHMNESGALFDIVKLNFVSKEWLAKLSKEEFNTMCLEWAKKYANQEDPQQFASIINENKNGLTDGH